MPKPDISARLRQMADDIDADEAWAEEDVKRVLAGADAARARVLAEKHWGQTAHVHRVNHEPVDITVPIYDEALEKDVDTVIDREPARCHDCGRALVNDTGDVPLLLCPKLHGQRPPKLLPKSALHAVECGDPENAS